MGSKCWSTKERPRCGSGPGTTPRSRPCERRPTANETQMEDRPTHLRPVPSAGSEATAPKLDDELEGTAGLTPPTGTGNSAMFLTDVVVSLGYATREQVDSVIDRSRNAGRP